LRYSLSPRAQADLNEIWKYTETHWSAAQAERYIRGIQTAIEAVAANPRRGRACDDIRPGYMKVVTGSHVVFYRLVDGGIDVVRVLHQRMDIDSQP
jgi:toxin ParE1/3/4